MFWKFFSIQKILDTLFDDGWCQLGLPERADEEALSCGFENNRSGAQIGTLLPTSNV